MGDYFNYSPDEFELPISRIHSLASTLIVKIKKLQKKVSDEDFLQVQILCEEVKNKILDYEDEIYLSATHNKCRRLYIASKLIISICLLHDKNADFGFKKTVNDALTVEKFKKISRKIQRKKFLEARKKKAFAELIKRKIFKKIKDKEDPEEDLEKDQRLDEDTHVQDKEPALPHQDTLAPALNISVPVPEPPIQVPENLTMIREEIQTMELQNLSFIPEVTPPPPVQTDIPLQRIIDETRESIEGILQILDDQAAAEINPPESVLEPVRQVVEETQIENTLADVEQKGDEAEVSDDLKLSSLESEGLIRRKRPRLIIDRITTIPNYAARAVVLNREVTIERIQVYEGPPLVIQSLSTEHLMKAPSFTTSRFRGVRSERLNDLYTRHLTLENCPAETLIVRGRRTFAEQQRREDTMPIQTHTAVTTVEDVGARIGMQSVPERRQALSEIIPETIVQEPVPRGLEPPPLDKGSLHDIDLLAMMAAIEPPDKTRTSILPRSPTPKIQQEQGKKLETTKSPTWFCSEKKTPPSPKWTEFRFVKQKLQQHWTLSELKGKGKAISISEMLKLEEDYTSANYLTLLRIVDKLSISREVYLENERGDVLIMPFLIPYVSAEQAVLRGKALKF